VDEAAAERSIKQVIVIRRDLRMRRGKEIAQGAHDDRIDPVTGDLELY
jgi:peptidyl-tRNA hydrolase